MVAALVSTGGSRRTCWVVKTSATPQAATNAMNGTTIRLIDVAVMMLVAPRSTCGAIVAEAPDGRFLDKVPGLVEFHLLNNGSEGEDCRSGASSKCREARGLFGAACFWAVHQPLHRQRRLRVHCQIVPREVR